MSLRILESLRASGYMGIAVLIAIGYGVMLMFFDRFIFVAPYFMVYITPTDFVILALDLILSILTGIVMAVSIKHVRSVSVKPRGAGFLGILAAIAGVCPVAVLALLLAVTGGLGATLGAVGIFMNAYQLPDKLASVIILLGASYGLERSLRMTCKLQ